MDSYAEDKFHWYLINCKSEYVAETSFYWKTDVPYFNMTELEKVKDHAECTLKITYPVITNIIRLGYMSQKYFTGA